MRLSCAILSTEAIVVQTLWTTEFSEIMGVTEGFSRTSLRLRVLLANLDWEPDGTQVSLVQIGNYRRQFCNIQCIQNDFIINYILRLCLGSPRQVTVKAERVMIVQLFISSFRWRPLVSFRCK